MRKKQIAVALLLFCLMLTALFCGKKKGAGKADPAVVEAAFAAMESRDAAQVTEIVMATPSLAYAKDEMNNTLLHLAAYRGYRDLALLLLEKGADVNALAARQFTPLHYAASLGHEQVCRLLVEKGVEVNAKDSEGQTALHWAAMNNLDSICGLLIENQALVNEKNNEGQTPLKLALERNQAEAAAVLQQSGGTAD